MDTLHAEVPFFFQVMKPHARFLKARTRTRTRRNQCFSLNSGALALALARKILTHGSLKNHLLGVLLARSCSPTTNGHTCPDLIHTPFFPSSAHDTARATLPTRPGARVDCARANKFASGESGGSSTQLLRAIHSSIQPCLLLLESLVGDLAIFLHRSPVVCRSISSSLISWVRFGFGFGVCYLSFVVPSLCGSPQFYPKAWFHRLRILQVVGIPISRSLCILSPIWPGAGG